MRAAAEARGPQPHRLAQDQQRPRPGPAGPPHGQDAGSSPRPAPASTAWPRATAAALLGMDCVVYMGEVDIARQALNVFRMRLLGAEVAPSPRAAARSRTRSTRPSATGWPPSRRPTTASVRSMGPHPYPWMVREFQRVVGDEARAQCRELLGGATPTSSSPASAAARTRRASSPASSTPRPSLVGVEPAGGAAIAGGVPGVVHGMRSVPQQDEAGQVLEAQSISAGLDYPGVGPEHSHLAAIGRARYETVTDDGGHRCVPAARRTEGIIPALEPAHALAWLVRARRAASRPPARRCSSTCRAAATRTSPR